MEEDKIEKGSIVVLKDKKDRHFYRVMKIEGEKVSLYRFQKSASCSFDSTLDKIELRK